MLTLNICDILFLKCSLQLIFSNFLIKWKNLHLLLDHAISFYLLCGNLWFKKRKNLNEAISKRGLQPLSHSFPSYNYQVVLPAVLTQSVLVFRCPPLWKCSVAMARWFPTATAPATTRSPTTSSSACRVSGRARPPARPSSSKSWTRPCWKSGTCAISSTARPPKLPTAASRPLGLKDQGSKP